jgi:exosome complex component MTR3
LTLETFTPDLLTPEPSTRKSAAQPHYVQRQSWHNDLYGNQKFNSFSNNILFLDIMSILQDRRRILGPTDAVPLSTASQNSVPSESRNPNQLRKIFLQPGGVSNCNGSAYIEVGREIRLQCSVYGPSPIRGSFTESAELVVETKVTPFAGKSLDNAQLAHDISSFVYSALRPVVMVEQYPKSSIGVLVTVISGGNNSKSLLAAATNVASVALMNARISLKDVVTAGSVAEDAKGVTHYDPEAADDFYGGGAVVAFCTGRGNSVTNVWIDGTEDAEIDPEKFDRLTDHALDIATQIRSLINGVVISEFQRLEKGS